MRKKAVTYKLVKNNRAVYVGVTSSPGLRNLQHSLSGKVYDRLVVTSPPLPRHEAERREARNIQSYRKATGENPRYNKTSDGKFKNRFGR